MRGEKQTIADHWLRHPNRRQYTKIVFEPGGLRTSGASNFWKGWGVLPIPGDCSLFLNHLRDNICAGSEALFRWVLAWFAQMLQNPTEKPGTAIVLRGRQGTGKTVVGKVFGVLLGLAYKHVANARRVTGQFNPHLEGCVLLHADEAFWAGDKQAESILKDLITNDVQWIERKGVDAVEVANHVRLLVASNAEWVIPAGLEERRFCVIDVGEARMQDKPYFAAIFEQMESGGYEALMDYCMRLNLGGIDLRTIPLTNALVEQKIASLSPEHGWWLDMLNNGYLPGDREGEGRVKRRRLYESYVQQGQNTGSRWRAIETRVGMFLRKVVPGLRRSDGTDPSDGSAAGYFEMPSLKVCREAFSRELRGFDQWDGPDSWQPDPTTVFSDEI